MSTLFADVFVGYPIEDAFTYSIPDGMNVQKGVRVKVNFAGRNISAFVVNVHGNKPSAYDTKDIFAVIDQSPIFDDRLISLAKYTASEYIAAPGEVLSLALPSSDKSSSRYKDRFIFNEAANVELSPEQRSVADDILSSSGTGSLAHLIYGITGSGKTEVYMDMARSTMEKGRSVIFLVPEISLSSQIFERLHRVFGRDLILYHSGLTVNQRLHNWKKFYSGEARIAVGTRSSIFLQCPDLGLIIIDEEHDGSYKEQSTPRYNARRLAFYRSKAENSILVMGSATPSMESLYSAEMGVMKLHVLKNRFGGATLPDIEVVKISGSESGMLSSKLKLHVKREIGSGKQAILLLNRRGFSPVVMCEDCGKAIECPNCSISMNYHRDGGLLCHYCGSIKSYPEACPSCASENLIRLGSGTQRIEEEVASEFKDMKIFRLDQDTSRKKDTAYNLVESMNKGEVDILLGTQMVAKGFDFPNVTVVGVLSADIGLHIPDFRATERIFSLLMQVSGRSGRGGARGRVIVQTFNEENGIFSFLKAHDYMAFYRAESAMRKSLSYPPFSRLARLLVRGKDESSVEKAAARLRSSIDESIGTIGGGVSALGPSQAPIYKISGNFRHHIILKSKSIDAIRKVILKSRDSVTGKGLYLEIDIDPYDML